MAFLLINRRKT